MILLHVVFASAPLLLPSTGIANKYLSHSRTSQVQTPESSSPRPIPRLDGQAQAQVLESQVQVYVRTLTSQSPTTGLLNIDRDTATIITGVPIQ